MSEANSTLLKNAVNETQTRIRSPQGSTAVATGLSSNLWGLCEGTELDKSLEHLANPS